MHEFVLHGVNGFLEKLVGERRGDEEAIYRIGSQAV